VCYIFQCVNTFVASASMRQMEDLKESKLRFVASTLYCTICTDVLHVMMGTGNRV
jgi:hypothetical protein